MQTHAAISLGALALLATCVACNSEAPARKTPAPKIPGAASPVPIATPSPLTWKVSNYGIGPLRSGMDWRQVEELLPALTPSSSLDSTECGYARSQNLPSGAVLMFEHGRLSRVDILTGRIATTEGASIGDTEAHIDSLYANRLTRSPHKYTNGNYLTVGPGSRTDSAFRIVFETDGSKVVRYRSGLVPAVEYVEGCG